MMARADIRERFNLEGDPLTDCLSAYCCPCCGLMQAEKEVEARTQGLQAGTQGYMKQ